MTLVNSMPPLDPSAPPGQPHMAPPELTHPGPPTGFIPQPLPPRPSDAPSPIGLIVAGIGLALLCVSTLLPRVNVDDPEGTFTFYSYAGIFGSGTTLDASTTVLSLALLAAVAVSAHRHPGVRWPARLGAIGAAALTATLAYYPVVAMRQYAEDFTGYDEFGEETPTSLVEVSAENGVYIAVFAVVILAASTFLMQVRMSRHYPAPQPRPPQQQVPAGWPGADPTITVTPG